MPENPKQDDTKNFVSLSPWLLSEMSGLSANAFRVCVLLVRKIVRRSGQREPTEETKNFHLSPQEFEIYGVPNESFKRAMKELKAKKFVQDTGQRNKRTCKMLKW